MTPMRRQSQRGLDATPMAPPPPMQFSGMPAMATLPPPDATGAQAIGGLAQLATALQGRLTRPSKSGGPVDAPTRRKTPFSEAAEGQLPYA